MTRFECKTEIWYFIPQYKYVLLNWFKKNRPQWKQVKLRKMSRDMLYVVYVKERSKYEV